MPTGYFLDTASSAAAGRCGSRRRVAEGRHDGPAPARPDRPASSRRRARDPTADPIGWSKLFFAGEPYGARVRSIIARALALLLGDAALRGPGSAAAAERLHRRPLPAARGAAGLQPRPGPTTATPRSPSRSATSATARGSNKLEHLRHLQRPGRGVPRPLAARARDGARAGERHGDDADLPLAHGITAARRRSRPPAARSARRAGRALHPGAVRISGAATRTVRSADSDATLGPMFTANFGTDDACLTAPQTTSPGAAVLRSRGHAAVHAARPADRPRHRSPRAGPTRSSPRGCGTSRPTAGSA